MGLVKILEDVGRGALGIILAGALTFCDTGTGSEVKEIKEEPVQTTTPKEIYGEVAGRIVAPRIENNQVVWFGRDNARIELDGILKTTSVTDGQFHLYDISAGNRNLIARYYFNGNTGGTITHKSESLSVPVYENMLTTINVDIKLNPDIPSEHILHGVVYNKDKTTRYNGTVNVNYARTGSGGTYPGSVEYSTPVSDGIYAFQGSVDGKFLTVIESGITKEIVLLPTENAQNEHSRIVLDYDGITEQNGYIKP